MKKAIIVFARGAIAIGYPQQFTEDNRTGSAEAR
jgi:hypothetical protein